MSHRLFTLTNWLPFVFLLGLSGCATSNTNSDAHQKEYPVILYVSCQSGEVDPVNILVTVDDKKVLSRDFPTGRNHDHFEVKMVLTGGVHQLVAESSNGNAGLDVVFTVDKPTWLNLDYWGKNHFQLNISYIGFLFV